MPELVTCPACGCRVQLPEMSLGKRTRCIACNHTFTAATGGSPTTQAIPTVPISYRPTEESAQPERPEPPSQPRGTGRQRLPLCPGCHRPVDWDDRICEHCGHLLGRDYDRPFYRGRRRDSEPHRGNTLDTLSSVSLLGALASFCLGPLGGIVALGIGIPVWVLAHQDLARMKTGEVDPDGESPTSNARHKSIVAVILGSLFSLGWILVYLPRFW